jgi:lipoprotein-releasing system ATP-binding protein
MTAPVIAAVAVTKTYRLGGNEIPVLRGVDLALQPGEMVALLGASGAGKSTLLHLLGLLDRPTTGEILYDGRPVHDLAVSERARLRHEHVGFVFQFYHLIPELTALQNVMLSSMMQRSIGQYWRARAELKARATQLLEQVGLGARLQHRPAELSGGERQRVAIARVLMQQPRAILADEPTGNLDSHTAAGVIEMLFGIHREQGMALLLVTHNEELATRCQRIVRLRDGIVEG